MPPAQRRAGGRHGGGFRGVREAVRAGARGLRGELRQGRGRRGGGGDRGRRARRRSLGRAPRRRQDPAVEPRHDRERVLDDQGHDRDLRQPARREGRARSRRAGRRVLARVRAGGQGTDPGALAALPQGGPRRDPQAAPRGRDARLEVHDRGARRRDAVVGAGHAARLPRADLRVPGRRGACGGSTGARSARTSATSSPRRSGSTSTSASGRSSTGAWPRCCRRRRHRPVSRTRSRPPRRTPSRWSARCSATRPSARAA